MGLRHSLEIVKRRKWSLVVCVVLGAATVATVAAVQRFDRTDSELVAPATAADRTAPNPPVRNIALGALIGLMLGVAVASAREGLDERIRSVDEVERVTGLPVLAELPRDPGKKKHRTRLAVIDDPRSPLSEAARALRASIELREPHAEPSSVLVASAVAGEGKSLVSANLAAAFALAGYRTVLVDGDLRTPRLSSIFGTYPKRLVNSGEAVPGLAGLLHQLGSAHVDRLALEKAALLRTSTDNLLFLPAGSEPANPADLLDSHAMTILLADLTGIADVVIIDSPPLLPVSDAAGLARQVHAVLLVAALGETPAPVLRRAQHILAPHPRVLGVVVNKVPERATYTPRRHATSEPEVAAAPRLSVIRKLEIPAPPYGLPDANGDIWIDLTEEHEPSRASAGAPPARVWSR